MKTEIIDEFISKYYEELPSLLNKGSDAVNKYIVDFLNELDLGGSLFSLMKEAIGEYNRRKDSTEKLHSDFTQPKWTFDFSYDGDVVIGTIEKEDVGKNRYVLTTDNLAIAITPDDYTFYHDDYYRNGVFPDVKNIVSVYYGEALVLQAWYRSPFSSANGEVSFDNYDGVFIPGVWIHSLYYLLNNYNSFINQRKEKMQRGYYDDLSRRFGGR